MSESRRVMSNSLQPSRLLYPWDSPGNLPNPGTEPGFPALQADSLLFEPLGKPSPYCKLSHNELIWWHNFPTKRWSLIPPHSSHKKDPGSPLTYKCSSSRPLPADMSHPHAQCLQELELKGAARCLEGSCGSGFQQQAMSLLGPGNEAQGLIWTA